MQILPLNQHYLDWFAQLLPKSQYLNLKAGGNWTGIGLIEDDTACGVLVAVVEEAYVELQYIVVAPEFRRRGVATAMMTWMAQRCTARFLPLIGHFDVASKADSLYLFFASCVGFSLAPTEDATYVTTISNLAPIAKFAQDTAIGVPFVRMNPDQREAMYQAGETAGYPFLRNYETQQALLDTQLSRCYFDENGVGAVLCYEKRDGDNLCLSFLYCRPDARKSMVSMLGETAQLLQKSVYQAGQLEVMAMSEESAGLVHKLMPDAQVVSQLYMLGQDIDHWMDA